MLECATRRAGATMPRWIHSWLDAAALAGSDAIACIKLVVFISALVATHLASAEEYVLELEVVNIQAGEGSLKIVLHDSALSYEKADHIPFRSISVPADSEHMTLRLEGIPPGRYAFIIYQDVNDNDDIDSNFIGWPKEPFGFSNNPPIRFGPPSFTKASFEVTGNQRVGVELR